MDGTTEDTWLHSGTRVTRTRVVQETLFRDREAISWATKVTEELDNNKKSVMMKKWIC